MEPARELNPSYIEALVLDEKPFIQETLGMPMGPDNHQQLERQKFVRVKIIRSTTLDHFDRNKSVATSDEYSKDSVVLIPVDFALQYDPKDTLMIQTPDHTWPRHLAYSVIVIKQRDADKPLSNSELVAKLYMSYESLKSHPVVNTRYELSTPRGDRKTYLERIKILTISSMVFNNEQAKQEFYDELEQQRKAFILHMFLHWRAAEIAALKTYLAHASDEQISLFDQQHITHPMDVELVSFIRENLRDIE